MWDFSYWEKWKIGIMVECYMLVEVLYGRLILDSKFGLPTKMEIILRL